MEVGQQPVPELLQLDQQIVRRAGVGGDAHHVALLVGELGPLIKHEHAGDLIAGDEEELLVPVGGEFLEAFVEEQRADRIAPLSAAATLTTRI
jgi:hypothetical protein